MGKNLAQLSNEQIQKLYDDLEGLPCRFFITTYLEGEVEDVEVEPKIAAQIVAGNHAIRGFYTGPTREQHSVRENGVSQVCYTVDDDLGLIDSLESPMYDIWKAERESDLDHLFDAVHYNNPDLEYDLNKGN